MTSTPLNSRPSAVSVAEVKYRTGLSLSAIYDACARGEIPNAKVGKRVLVSRVWLDATFPEALNHG